MNRYLTTTLPYVNADPHIGFALEIVQADALVRTWRAEGDEVFFNTGTDEHGQKIFEAAEKAGKDVQEYVDYYASEFRKLKELLNLSNDTFIRTTDAHHIAAAQEMWKRCDAAGDIYKKAYEGLYCVGCEKFLTERDMEEGKCVIHKTEPVVLKEENYFFRLSKYQDKLVAYLSRPGVVVPDWRREEALNFVNAGLEDFSISREKARLSWGIPVPGDDSQVMYVWFDALTNYISTLGWPEAGGNFEKFWENGQVLQMAGKDQVRFQSLMFQAMLMSANVKNSDVVFYHGFITSGGSKMSKSVGNVISPYDLVKKYGIDATRYLLLRHVHPFEDSDVTWERLDEWYTANLVNGLGNLVARVMKLAEEHLEQPADATAEDLKVESAFTDLVHQFKFNEAADLIFAHVAKGDEYMTTEEPYKKIKDEATAVQARTVIEELVIHIGKLAMHLAPFMPATAEAILKAVRENTEAGEPVPASAVKYFDAHCHVQFAQYDEDRAEVLAAMEREEIGGLIVGTDSTHSQKAVEMANGTTLFAAVGLHPNDKPNEGYNDAFYRKLAANPNVVAIGECGLDYFRPENPEAEKARQKEVFEKHIQLAIDLNKPLMVHARPSKGSMDAYLDAIEMMKGRNVRANMHFYVGDLETTKKFLELGCTFSFTAVLTFARDYDDVVRYIPLENLLSETDAPYVAPAPNRGKRNDPLAVRDVVRAIADIRKENEETVREVILANAQRVFLK